MVVPTHTDYYLFGMPISGRQGNSGSQNRWGFNGLESNDEMSRAAGNSYTTFFRQYDARLGRWFSTDPVVHSFQSPYCAFDNNPILFSDQRGDNTIKEGKDLDDDNQLNGRKIESNKIYELGSGILSRIAFDKIQRAAQTYLSTPNATQIKIIIGTSARNIDQPSTNPDGRSVRQLLWDRSSVVRQLLINQDVPTSAIQGDWLELEPGTSPSTTIQIRTR